MFAPSHAKLKEVLLDMTWDFYGQGRAVGLKTIENV
jgi:hypothetical protein